MSSLPVVLVTGATGSTGVEVVRALSASGQFQIRAGVRDVEKAQSLSKLPHVALTRLDSDAASASSAFKGVQAVYLLTAPKTPAFDVWLPAIQSAGVRQVVYHSSVGVSATAALQMAVEHFHHEERLKAIPGLQWTMLQPTYFHQNMEKFNLPSIQQYSMYGGSAGDGRFSSVDLRDVAAVAVEAFKEPNRHSGKAYELTGDLTTEPTIAALISEVAGRTVRYESWTVEEHRQKLKEWGVPDWLAADMLVLDKMKREGWANKLAPELEQILGREGITIKQYIQDTTPLWKQTKG